MQLAVSRYSCDWSPRGNSRQLVVLVHGYVKDASALKDVRSAVEQSMPDADLLISDFPTKLFSNADPVEFAEDLVGCLTHVCEKTTTMRSF